MWPNVVRQQAVELMPPSTERAYRPAMAMFHVKHLDFVIFDRARRRQEDRRSDPVAGVVRYLVGHQAREINPCVRSLDNASGVRIVAKTFAAPCRDPHGPVWVERVATCRRPPLNDMATALDSHIGGQWFAGPPSLMFHVKHRGRASL